MARYDIPAQNLSLNIPDDGEVFRRTDDPQGAIYIRKGNQLLVTSLENIARQAGYGSLPTDQRYARARDILAQQGINYDSLPTPSYNFADISRVFQSAPGFTVGTLTDLALLKTSTPTKGEVITQTVSPSNANAPVVTSNLQGVLSKAAPEPSAGAIDPSVAGFENPNRDFNYGPDAISRTATPPATPGASGTGEYRNPNADYNYGPDAPQGGAQSAAAANPALDQLLANPNLTDDQRNMIRALYGAISTNDRAKADQIRAGIEAATQYSDPFFKAQTRLALDALDRSFNATDGDLAYNETKLRNSLNDLRKDIEASKETLAVDEVSQLRDLERRLQTELDTTIDDMAARGFTSSSIRTKKETLLKDSFGDLRESTRRSFATKQSEQDRALARGERNYGVEVARIQELARQNKLGAARKAEETVGSQALGGRYPQLGGIGGTIPRAQAQDALSFSREFVF